MSMFDSHFQIIRQQFPQLTTRRLGTRGQSKYEFIISEISQNITLMNYIRILPICFDSIIRREHYTTTINILLHSNKLHA